MPDLPSVICSALDRLESEIVSIRKGGSKKNPKPHKLILLLAVLDLAEVGLLPENKVYFDERLIALFEEHFRQFSINDDWCQPAPPYFHLRSAGFWHHKIRPGREQFYAKLTTSGGGKKRIVENIEYAYLSPYAFSVITDPLARNQLRGFINIQLGELMAKRIGTMFHETFSLSRPAIGAVISAISETQVHKNLHAMLRNKTHLGTNYIKAMPQYARGCGLISMGNEITSFGARVVELDPMMETHTTQWLMHYFLSAPHGPGPAFWHEFVRTRFRFGNKFTKNSIVEQLLDFWGSHHSKELKTISASSTANAFVGTYEKDDALGRLSIIENIGEDYRVLEPEPPPVWAFAVALLDFWQHQFPNRVTVNLDELYADGGLTSIFMIGAGRINRYLRILQQEGMVDVFRVAPPYQVALLNADPAFALNRLYTSHDDD